MNFKSFKKIQKPRNVYEGVQRKGSTPRGWRVSYVTYGGMSYGPDASSMNKRVPMPSWVKTESDAVGVALCMVFSGFEIDPTDITRNDVIESFKDYEETYEMDESSFDLNATIEHFNNGSLTFVDYQDYLEGGMDDTEEGFIGYINKPNNRIIDINKDMWDDELEAELNADW